MIAHSTSAFLRLVACGIDKVPILVEGLSASIKLPVGALSLASLVGHAARDGLGAGTSASGRISLLAQVVLVHLEELIVLGLIGLRVVKALVSTSVPHVVVLVAVSVISLEVLVVLCIPRPDAGIAQLILLQLW